MRKAAIWIPAGVLVVVALVLWWPRERAAERKTTGRGAGNAAGSTATRPAAGSTVAQTSLSPNEARPAAGTGEAYLEHTFRSFVTAQQAEIGLSDAEASRLVSDLLEMYEVETELAERFVAETKVEPDAVTVRVPPFPVEGKALRDLLYRRLQTDFPSQAAKIGSEMGGFIDDAFRGFGITDQTIVLKRTDSPDTFEVTWNAMVAAGQTPSREPDGTTYGGSSGVMLFSRDQIESGEYRFLAPILIRRFPAAVPAQSRGPAR